MKSPVSFPLLFVMVMFLLVQLSVRSQNAEYNQQLADSLGADDYGMKSYTFCLLKTGPVTIEDKAVRDSLFRGHLDNISRLAEAGKIIVAGPLGKNEHSYRGIFIFDETAHSKVDSLLQTDPAIHAGVLDAELFSWYGSAALPAYLEVHEKIEKRSP